MVYPVDGPQEYDRTHVACQQEGCQPNRYPYGKPKQTIFGPIATAISCFLPTVKVMGDALFSPLAGKCHRVFPSRSSTATKSPLGSPQNTSPPAVAKTPAHRFPSDGPNCGFS